MEMRKVYANTINKLFEKDNNVFALEADLSNSMATTSLKEKLGKNYINVGIMEANMISVAAGINLAGGYPFIHSFGQFLARRALDQIFVSLAYANLKGCLVGSDSGVTAEHNGGTHMTFEDIGALRIIPTMKIYDVCDEVEFAKILENTYKKNELAYIRTNRKNSPLSFYNENEDFSNCGAKVIKEGKDITLIACGIEVKEALDAAEYLIEKNISVEVIDAFSIKPLDSEVITKSAMKTGKIITCENHNIIGGLGSAVTELLSEKEDLKIKRLGIKDKFGQVGKLDYLKEFYEIDSNSIVKEAENFIK